ncbi:cytochrome C [Piscinibacter sp. XHJ-5]|uniref:c-type cytochrome n=1 Tax=Piscinibacter sp. XHJ-5 TaxID=3037797 RepID=UPI0024536DA9|nr:cytochrome C [Piscinibacter sp. XHJ-5]
MDVLKAAMALAWLSAATASMAQDERTLQVRSLAATCATCHGTEGRALEGTPLLPLAGMPAPQLARQMRAFRSGDRPSTVMQQIIKGYTDAQIDQLAAWFAAQAH